MEYEFKSIVLSKGTGVHIGRQENELLNNEFKNGWEYVDSICQSNASGKDSDRFGMVLIVLKKRAEL